MPAFHKKRVEYDRDDMGHSTEQLLAGWKPGALRDVWHDLTRLTLHIANKTLFGLEVKDVTNSLGSMITELRGDAPTIEQLARLPQLRHHAGGAPGAGGQRDLLQPYVTHRVPELYADASRFCPERWETLERSPPWR
jgi:cytochrome P450